VKRDSAIDHFHQLMVVPHLVSRRHSLIVITGDSATIEDLGSKNGTYLNGKRLEEADPLSHGGRITLGRLAARYRFVTGHSQGGYSAMRVALRRPD